MRPYLCIASLNRFAIRLLAMFMLLFLTTILIPVHNLSASSTSLLAEADRLLDEGNLWAAIGKYRVACTSSDHDTRLAARIGLGRVYRQIPTKRLFSLRHLRLAQKIEPGNLDVLYEIALTGLRLDFSSGKSIADDALTEIICQEPDYRDAYKFWRGEIIGRSMSNMEKVAKYLPEHIAHEPLLNYLWLDIAYDWFFMFKTDNCMAALDSLLKVAPEYKPQEQILLRARCFLSNGDKDSFEEYYNQALKAAEQERDFYRLIAEAELIFIPAEDSILQSMQTAAQVAGFFNVFWKNKDPDLTTPCNERLIEHYERLREAEFKYRILTPNGLVNNSDDYLRLMSRTNEFAGDIGTASYKYDPAKVFRRRSSDINLDHRGLLFVRHGPPDGIERIYIYDRRDGFLENLGKGPEDLDIPNSSVWRYGNNTMIFKSGKGTGGYMYYPSVSPETADIERAMQSQSFRNPLPMKPQDYYCATFLRSDGKLDLEFYQSLPVKDSKVTDPPQAVMVLYDFSLNELVRKENASVAAYSPGDSVWLALTSVPVDPSDYVFALSLTLPDIRAAVKNVYHLEPISISDLSTSDIVLGVGTGGELDTYSRGEVELLPRPSLEFSLDEFVETLFEIYNLKKDPAGRSEYLVSVTIKLIEQDRTQIGKLLEKFRLLGQERGIELTMEFERTYTADSLAVVESFTINTSELIPGNYLLIIVIKDKLSGDRIGVQREFKLVD